MLIKEKKLYLLIFVNIHKYLKSTKYLFSEYPREKFFIPKKSSNPNCFTKSLLVPIKHL